MTYPPIALTVAGSDSGGGAGIQADLKAMSANGVYGASVITAVTAQNTIAVTAVHEVPAHLVAEQLAAVLSDLDVRAIKLGMLFSVPIISAVATALHTFDGPIVVDPVMIAKSGDALLKEDAVAAMVRDILPLATLLTPNLPEAAQLTGTPQAETPEAMSAQAAALLALGPEAVLMKGGHADGQTCTDLLVDGTGILATHSAPRQATKNTHGTGCTYSATIAALMARGQGVEAAVASAHGYLQAAIQAADDLRIGAGHGPVHHFHGLWG
ncbi:bifunctional hydroxymethylpyrimidine kinase/phosphomethylpyrimidine kinase [uncultured Roseobacter sp.]|uniref:bifunctional hydroxymethylpyrimidine kinase/phosphomethylpyrimidine kinase n=1 Tax=uncultured Roseobacter sp. TaxID=114847 RepID=UPI00262DF0C1|nr:bifunctional hydroxymethylpyrimidine kinase/phosphomethylpyrimidine kinase [uncultured Roseobacter sp.]